MLDQGKIDALRQSSNGTQSAASPFGGYFCPFFSTFGSQEHRDSSGTVSMTIGTWLPQPHHVFFAESDGQ